MEAVRAPYLTRPTLRGSGVRDTSLTDFEGKVQILKVKVQILPDFEGKAQEHSYRELRTEFNSCHNTLEKIDILSEIQLVGRF